MDRFALVDMTLHNVDVQDDGCFALTSYQRSRYTNFLNIKFDEKSYGIDRHTKSNILNRSGVNEIKELVFPFDGNINLKGVIRITCKTVIHRGICLTSSIQFLRGSSVENIGDNGVAAVHTKVEHFTRDIKSISFAVITDTHGFSYINFISFNENTLSPSTTIKTNINLFVEIMAMQYIKAFKRLLKCSKTRNVHNDYKTKMILNKVERSICLNRLYEDFFSFKYPTMKEESQFIDGSEPIIFEDGALKAHLKTGGELNPFIQEMAKNIGVVLKLQEFNVAREQSVKEYPLEVEQISKDMLLQKEIELNELFEVEPENLRRQELSKMLVEIDALIINRIEMVDDTNITETNLDIDETNVENPVAIPADPVPDPVPEIVPEIVPPADLYRGSDLGYTAPPLTDLTVPATMVSDLLNSSFNNTIFSPDNILSLTGDTSTDDNAVGGMLNFTSGPSTIDLGSNSWVDQFHPPSDPELNPTLNPIAPEPPIPEPEPVIVVQKPRPALGFFGPLKSIFANEFAIKIVLLITIISILLILIT